MTIELNRRLVLGGMAALPACRASGDKFDAEVLILGAGLSGLHAARLLEAEGRNVLVLEGSNRIGGRLHTLDWGILGSTEGGGEQIGANYARIIDTARSVGVALTPDRPQSSGTSYFFKNRLYSAEDWIAKNPHNFPNPFSGASPASPLFALAAKANPLTAPQDWRDSKFAAHDISARDFLEAQGLDENTRNIIDTALNGNNLETYSMMNLYRTLQLFSASRGMGASLSVDGGSQKLPEAMATSLSRPVKMNKIANRIQVSDTSVEVLTTEGKIIRAPHCICTIPFGALKKLRLLAPLNTAQKLALQDMPYTQIYQIHFAAGPFWEADGLPADMWTDSPIERVFANKGKDGKPNGLFRAWINGTGARKWINENKLIGQVNPGMLTRFEEIFSAIRPDSIGNLNVLAGKNWTWRNKSTGGAYMHWAPGQIPLMAENMGKPAGRLHFAGEHLGYLHTGMEAAMESAENAAFSLMDI